MDKDYIAKVLRPRDWLHINRFLFSRFVMYALRNIFSVSNSVRIDGIILHLSKEFSRDVKRALWSGAYEAAERQIVSNTIREKDIVLEIGAGIGYISTLCARLIGGERVHAIEANPEMISIIRNTYKLNNVNPYIHNVCVSRKNENIEFFVSDKFYSSSINLRQGVSNKILVKGKCINDLIEEISPSFLIVDVEGAELDLFFDASLDNIEKICIEVHPHIIGQKNVSRVIECLLSRGFYLSVDISIDRVLFFSREQ